jgi:hypothetical protein
MYATVEITRGWETWKKMAEEMNPEMGRSNTKSWI